MGGNTEGEGRGIPYWNDWNKKARNLKIIPTFLLFNNMQKYSYLR